MSYKSNFKNEKEPTRRYLFNEGWHQWTVKSIEEKTSKSNNPMFVINLEHTYLYKTINVYAIAVEEKQWLLKQFLAACEVPIDADGNCEWDVSNVLGKTVMGFIENDDNEFINREGHPIVTKQSKIVEFKSFEVEVI